MMGSNQGPQGPERATPVTGPAGVEDSAERRIFDRYDVEWSVDCVATDTFLYASITNISEMGIFVRTTEPLKLNTKLRLTFAPPGGDEWLPARGLRRLGQLRSRERRQPEPGHGHPLREPPARRARAPRRGDPHDRVPARRSRATTERLTRVASSRCAAAHSVGSGKRRATMPAPVALLSSQRSRRTGRSRPTATAGFARVRPSVRLAWNSVD